jgi:hypothetical protein
LFTACKSCHNIPMLPSILWPACFVFSSLVTRNTSPQFCLRFFCVGNFHSSQISFQLEMTRPISRSESNNRIKSVSPIAPKAITVPGYGNPNEPNGQPTSYIWARSQFIRHAYGCILAWSASRIVCLSSRFDVCKARVGLFLTFLCISKHNLMNLWGNPVILASQVSSPMEIFDKIQTHRNLSERWGKCQWGRDERVPVMRRWKECQWAKDERSINEDEMRRVSMSKRCGTI